MTRTYAVLGAVLHMFLRCVTHCFGASSSQNTVYSMRAAQVTHWLAWQSQPCNGFVWVTRSKRNRRHGSIRSMRAVSGALSAMQATKTIMPCRVTHCADEIGHTLACMANSAMQRLRLGNPVDAKSPAWLDSLYARCIWRIAWHASHQDNHALPGDSLRR